MTRPLHAILAVVPNTLADAGRLDLPSRRRWVDGVIGAGPAGTPLSTARLSRTATAIVGVQYGEIQTARRLAALALRWAH